MSGAGECGNGVGGCWLSHGRGWGLLPGSCKEAPRATRTTHLTHRVNGRFHGELALPRARGLVHQRAGRLPRALPLCVIEPGLDFALHERCSAIAQVVSPRLVPIGPARLGVEGGAAIAPFLVESIDSLRESIDSL